MVTWSKLSAAMGSGLPDPSTDVAASQPTPLPAIANKPAPGQKGPVGLAPRASFTRVNTGSPPVPDAGASAQKTQSPRGMEFLRAKTAHQEKNMSTTMMRRPDLNDLIKEAMEGTVDKIDIQSEVERQMQHTGESTKTASAQETADRVPTEYVNKLAGALYHLAKQASAPGPGTGPGALPVSTPAATGSLPGPNGQGQAHKQPWTPADASSGVAKDPPTGLKTDMNKSAEALFTANLEAVKAASAKTVAGVIDSGLAGKAGKFLSDNAGPIGLGAATSALAGGVGYGVGKMRDKTASPLPIDRMFELYQAKVAESTKVAEDAINPAHISAGSAPAKNPPPGVSVAEENAPSIPSLLQSNLAVINATRRETKAQPKAELKSVLTEPALTSSTDSTLNQAWAHTGEAGAKIASSLTRTAAAQALLSKLAEDAKDADKDKAKKEKNSQGMGGLSSPSGQSGFNAASMGGS